MMKDNNEIFLEGAVDVVAGTNDLGRPCRIYHVILDNGATDVYTMCDVVQMITHIGRSSQSNTKVPEALLQALKLAQNQEAQRVAEHREKTGQTPLSRQAVKKKAYNNLRASIDRYRRRDWMNHYGLDPDGRSSDPIQDSVLGKVTETPERLRDNTQALAPSWWNSNETAQAVITGLGTKLPVRKVKLT